MRGRHHPPTGSPLQGSAPVDLDLIPLSAIDHIEVLRDGAAAQYGSDAIAGVVNIILKAADHGGTATADVGNYYDGGGFTAGGAGDIGTTLGDNGFFHLSGDYNHHNHSVRSQVLQRLDQTPASRQWTR